MAKSNRICFLCGKKYHYCPTCSADINKPSWYAMWCSEECKDLDRILAAHTMKQITTEEARKKIKDLNLKDAKFADENVEKHYNEIMNEKEINNLLEENEVNNSINEESKADKESNKNNVKTKVASKSQRK